MLTNFVVSLSVVIAAALAHAQAPVIKIDGSSTVFPITEAMAEEFQSSQRGKVRVTVGISGTGGGFKKFCRGETDVQNASRPIQASEIETCRKAGIKFLELPIAYDATAVVVNPKNTWLKSITVAELKKMWEPGAQGKINTWADVNPAWPKEKLKLYGAGSDSGTFDYFTEAVVGKSKSSRGDYTASEDDNTLVTGVSNDLYALGYVPLAYYEENKGKLKVVAIVGGDKAPKKNEAVLPGRETVENGSYFPLSRPIFIYVSEKSMAKAEVKEFVNFYISKSFEIVPQVKYVPLPAKAYDMVKDHVKKNKLGTVFGGHSEVGLKIEELMKREGSL
ncbi:PstS family phosphate ABC transporter substrate-binding protein [Bdellovibrio bacteriovorus]|uniref:Phosphate-binding protein n=1 Tax=Bdellovibrio bacteriovorus str. Tiberius TaxID=1069642 RepID=K7ZFA9_BDEBC|nr:PstS family phosphate ABC transporter substrate-binding protein [Bdellovibrio bacteriovorus]AFY01342.1 periplasmic phosphate-binding protein of ABC transporter [Bdellovibrio bacteriovorus str. Tiberius]